MTRPDPMTIAQRVFNTPLFLDPAKAAAIVEGLGARLLNLGDGSRLDLDAAGVEVADVHRKPRPEAASLLGDGLFKSLQRHGGGFSIVQGVAVIPVIGTLVRRGSWVGQSSGQTSYEGIAAQIRAAVEHDEVRAIALEIDSFGGEAAGIFALAKLVREAREIKPVRAFVADYAYSAGYAVASQADRITVPEFGGVGSIGVVCLHADYSKRLEQAGIRVTLIQSGAKKTEGNPYEPLPDGVRAALQKDNDAMWAEFARIVEAGRRGKISTAGALGLEAGCFRGAASLPVGLADEVIEARDGFAAFVEEISPSAAILPPGRAAGHLPHSTAESYRVPGFTVLDPTHMRAALTDEVRATIESLAAHVASEELLGHSQITRRESGTIGAAAPQLKESDMSKDVETPVREAEPEKKAAGPVTGAPETSADDVRRESRERASKIIGKVAAAGLPSSFAQKLIDDETPLADAYEAIIDAKAAKAQDGGDIRNVASSGIRVTGDAMDRCREGMTLALLGKAGLDGGARNEFTGMTLREMARQVLTVQGLSIPHGGVQQLASAAFVPSMAGGMHSTSDFGNILADVAHKAMLKGFEESPEIFERFTSTGTMSDFKPHKRVGLDAFPALTKVQEGAEFQYGSVGDHGETALLATYGKLFAITRQTIINDDLDAFTRVPRRMGRAARRTVGDLVFAVLTANGNMSDGTALFHADHGNLAGTARGPSEAAINDAITAMSTQKDRGGSANLNISPAFLLAPPKWRSAALQALNSEYAPDDTDKVGTAKMQRAYNTVRDAAEPLFDARLSGDAWFMLASPTMFDTIEVGYLDGVSAPFLDQQDGWSVDGTEFKVRIDACATALAWEAMYKNAGS